MGKIFAMYTKNWNWNNDFLWNQPQKKQFLKIKTLFSLLKSLGTTSKISFLQLYKMIRINHTNIESIIFLRYWLTQICLCSSMYEVLVLVSTSLWVFVNKLDGSYTRNLIFSGTNSKSSKNGSLSMDRIISKLISSKLISQFCASI